LEARSLPEAATAGRIVRGLNDGISMARQLARGLYPVSLQSEGLPAALLELAAQTRHLFSLGCTGECAEEAIVRDQAVATHLYRIAQEAVHNAVRHARPSHISIGLSVPNGKIVLTVADDGIGIPAAVRPGEGMGLAIMRYRAGMIGGTLEVRRADTAAPPDGCSTPARGTIVSCSLPLESPEGGFSI
jgi:signal transduction histidine kinase